MRIRKVSMMLLCFSVMVSIMGLSGCSKDKTGKDADSGKTKKLTIWWADGEVHKPVIEKAIEQYKKVKPDVEINVQWQPNFDIYDKLKVSLAGKNAPDITKLDHVYVANLGYRKQLVELTALGANDIKDQFIESTWKANMYKDKVYALPFDANTIAFFYNKDILDKAGKQPPKTYQEIIDAGKSINALQLPATFAYTIPVTQGGSGWLTFQWLFWLWRSGGDVLNEEWSQAVYNSPEGIQALEMIIDMRNQGIIAKDAYLEGEFYQGKVAMLDMGCWNVPQLTKPDKAANFGIAMMPQLKEGVPGYSGLGLFSMGILSQCKEQKEAYEFIKYVTTNKEYQTEYAKKTNLMPSLKEAYNDEMFKTPEWQVFFEQIKLSKSRPGTPAWPEIAENISVAIQEALSGKKTPKQALDNAVVKSNEALSRIK